MFAEKYTRIFTPSDQEFLDEDPTLPAAQRGWCQFFAFASNPYCGIPVDGNAENTTWKCSTATVIDDRVCLVPDALVPRVDPYYGDTRNAFPFDVPAGENRAVWADVHVPTNAVAGTYTGTVDVHAGALHALLTLRVAVLGYTMPPFGTNPAVDLDAGVRGSIGSFCVVMGCSGSSADDRAQVYSLFVRAALEDRFPLTTVAIDDPTAGANRTAFDRWLLPYLNGETPTTTIDGVLPPLWSGLKNRHVFFDGNASAAQWNTWASALGADNVQSALSYYCDEVMNDATSFANACGTPFANNARAGWNSAGAGSAGPPVALIGNQQQYTTARGWTYPNPTTTQAVADTLARANVLIPVDSDVHDKATADGGRAGWGNKRPSYDAAGGWLTTAGHALWSYTSNMSVGGGNGWTPHRYWSGWPSSSGADQPATSERADGLVASAYKISGHFYYEAFHQFANAWHDCSATPNACLYDGFGGHGDGTLFYPGTTAVIGGTRAVAAPLNNIPIESIRLKRYRDGSQDYTLTRLLETGCAGTCITRDHAQLLPIIGGPDAAPGTGLFPSMSATSVGAVRYLAARDQLLDLLSPTVSSAPIRVAYSSTANGNPDVWVTDVDGTNRHTLTNDTHADTQPSWSPDGTRLAFTSNRGGTNQVFVMNADGSNRQLLTTDPVSASKPSWSPDGTKVAFTSRRNGNNDVYVTTLAGAATPLVTGTANDDDATWSADDARLVFASDRAGSGADLYTVNANGSGITIFTGAAGDDDSPDWSRSGTTIAFDRSTGGNYDVLEQNAAGGGLVNLTPSTPSFNDYAPSWSPEKREGRVRQQSSRRRRGTSS